MKPVFRAVVTLGPCSLDGRMVQSDDWEVTQSSSGSGA
jgi:hypothetical protein